MAQYIYTLEKARKAHGDKVVLDNGEARLMPGYSVGMLAQEPPLNEDKTVLGNIEEAVAETKAKLERFNNIAEQMATDYTDELMEEMGKLQEELDHSNAWDVDSQLELAMDALRCPPPDMPVNILSGGEKRRVALTRLLLTEPDILLLDEPTNHLDAESVAWLEHHLREYKGTVIAVTHDRYFLDNVAGWILELDRGYGIPWKGNYSSWLEQKQERVRLEEKSDRLLHDHQAVRAEVDLVAVGPYQVRVRGEHPVVSAHQHP